MENNSVNRHIHNKPKRFRSAFTTEQTNYLEEAYKRFPYVDKEERQRLASILKLGERPIKIWFQNRRMKEKKETQNHKDSNDGVLGNTQFDHDQLINVSALPLSNDTPNSHTLPISSSTAESSCNVMHQRAHVNTMEADIIDCSKKIPTKTANHSITVPTFKQESSRTKANFYIEVQNLEHEQHLSPYVHQQPTVDSTVPSTTNLKKKMLKSQECETTSAEFSINLCKKFRQKRASTDAAVNSNIVDDDQKTKTETKQTPEKKANHASPHKDLPPNKKFKISHTVPPPKQSTSVLNKPMYYPVMHSVYAPPYMAPDGVIWNPVNFMPVIAANGSSIGTIGNQVPLVRGSSKNCSCNCHGSSSHIPISLPPSLQNPYAQYVITVPIPHTSSNF